MRKVFWSFAALAVAGAAGMHLAADYTRRHPDSFLGQVTLTAYRVAVRNNPVFALSHAVSGNACQSVRTMTDTPSGKSAAAGCASIELEVRGAGQPGPCRLPGRIVLSEDEESSPPEVRRACAVDEMIEWPLAGVVVELIPEPRSVEGEAAEAPVQELPPPNLFPFVGGPEANEDKYRIMPRVEDDAPTVMPYADEPNIEATGKRACGCSRGSFCWLGFFTELCFECLSRKAPPADCCKEEPSEPPAGGQPPDCREDPLRHHQYPGCPSMSCPHSRYYCPYSGHRVVPSHEPEIRPPSAPVPPETPDRLMKSGAGRMRKSVGASEECKGCRTGPYVDTMEFRRSDAKPGEFGLLPF